MQRTFEKEGYRTEQEGNHQVADGKIYYGWMQMDAKNDWQLWTAISNLDGSNFRATQRTTDGGGIPNVQVAGDTVYYMYVKRYRVDDPTHKRNRETLYFAVSDKNGEGWRELLRRHRRRDAARLARVSGKQRQDLFQLWRAGQSECPPV